MWGGTAGPQPTASSAFAAWAAIFQSVVGLRAERGKKSSYLSDTTRLPAVARTSDVIPAPSKGVPVVFTPICASI